MNNSRLDYNELYCIIPRTETDLNMFPMEIIGYINQYVREYLDDQTIRMAIHNWFGYL